MSTNKCVKWGKKANDFFETAPENSIILDIITSYEYPRQSRDELEELVNSINSKNIKRKIKNINILDTSYLYRYITPIFSKYSDPAVQTLWFSENHHILEKLTVDTVLKSWVAEINTETYVSSLKQIRIDYAGDENGNGLVQEFRDLVIADASVIAYKYNKNLENCANFILEKCAYAYANFREIINLIYPTKISCPVLYVTKRYLMNINHLRYKTSTQSEDEAECLSSDLIAINRKVASFINEKVSNAFFFVIDKRDNYIYKKHAPDVSVGKINAKNINLQKAEELERQNKLLVLRINELEKFNALISHIAHDVVSPLASLKALMSTGGNFHPQQRTILKDAINSIGNVANTLLDRYKQNQKDKYLRQEQHILVHLAISEVVSSKVYKLTERDIVLKYEADLPLIFTSIKADPENFNCMISNLIDNS
ncbi:MAG: hypothetical protein LBB12_01395, partial [Holosporaceae bacterium]|nr:hypothetical protein [Holosporaceae bacterium]